MDILELLDDQVKMYSEMCGLTTLELNALDSKDWVEVERLETFRVSLFNRIIFLSEGTTFTAEALGTNPSVGELEDFEVKLSELKGLMSELSKIDSLIGNVAAVEMKSIEEELTLLYKKKNALKVYYPDHEGAVYIDRKA